jgi:hypothetical protein
MTKAPKNSIKATTIKNNNVKAAKPIIIRILAEIRSH